MGAASATLRTEADPGRGPGSYHVVVACPRLATPVEWTPAVDRLTIEQAATLAVIYHELLCRACDTQWVWRRADRRPEWAAEARRWCEHVVEERARGG